MNKMLIVEDDLLSQDLFRRIFKNKFIISICDSSEEYYDKYSEDNYDIIIMDIALKGKKQGIDLIKEIRETKDKKNTPIICLTAHAHNINKVNSLEAGADLFFTKPIHNTELVEAVDSLLRRI